MDFEDGAVDSNGKLASSELDLDNVRNSLGDLSDEIIADLYKKINVTPLGKFDAFVLKMVDRKLFDKLNLNQMQSEARLSDLKKSYDNLLSKDPHQLDAKATFDIVTKIDKELKKMPFENTGLMLSMPIPELELTKLDLRMKLLAAFNVYKAKADAELLELVFDNFDLMIVGIVDSLTADYNLIEERIDVLLKNPELILKAFELTLEILKQIPPEKAYNYAIDKVAEFIGDTVDTGGARVPYEFGYLLGKVLPLIITGGNSAGLTATKILSYGSFEVGDYGFCLSDYRIYNKVLKFLSLRYPHYHYSQLKSVYFDFANTYNEASIQEKAQLNIDIGMLGKDLDFKVFNNTFLVQLFEKLLAAKE